MADEKTFPNYIDGEWTASERTFENSSPADTGDCVGVFCRGSRADVDAAAAAAQEAYPAWAAMNAPQRAKYLFKVADILESNLDSLAREMTQLAQLDTDPEAVLDSGAAMDKWREMIAAQDGDPDAPLPEPRETEEIPAPASGYLAELDALSVGIAAWRLGAGRASKEDPVSAAAGITWHFRPGDAIKAGETLFTLHTDDPSRIPSAMEALEGGFAIADAPPAMTPVVLGRVE